MPYTRICNHLLATSLGSRSLIDQAQALRGLTKGLSP